MGGGRNIWVIVPAYEEAQVIGLVLEDLRTVGCNVVVVDDGSSDGTGGKALEYGATVLRHVVNLGQGAALQTGIEYALKRGASHICTFDADGQHSAASIPVLIEQLDQSGCDIVLGSRTLGSSVGMPAVKKWLLRLALCFTRLHSGLPVTDTHNGLRMMTRAAAQKIRLRHPGMTHASEFLSQIRSHGLRFTEAPVTVTYTAYSIGKGQHMFNALRILADLFCERWSK
jgi:glycosyltransferase involved in cell wall biosynthesis